MSRWLERLKREKAEKEARKLAREEKKKEKEKEKKKAQREKKKKLNMRRRNRRAYVKRRNAELKQRKKEGDEKSYFSILVMKNNKRVKHLAHAWWKTNAYKKYHDLIRENRETVKFPLKITETSEDKQKKNQRFATQKYEIMLLQKVGGFEEKVTHLRDETGRFVENVIVDNDDFLILTKDEWLVEETFSVYGYHPNKDRKDFNFILNEMILKDCDADNIKRVFVFNNRLIIQYDSDFDFVTCKTADECKRLYNTLQKHVSKNEYVLFTGSLTKEMSTWMLNEIEAKTGWDRNSCKRIHTL